MKIAISFLLVLCYTVATGQFHSTPRLDTTFHDKKGNRLENREKTYFYRLIQDIAIKDNETGTDDEDNLLRAFENQRVSMTIPLSVARID